MGLMESTKLDSKWTVILLVVALLLDLVWSQPEPERQLAQQLLGADAVRLELETGPAFQLQDRWLLFFEKRGKIGPIRGAVLIEDDRIRELILIEANEGVDRSAFSDGTIANSLIEQAARAPVAAQVVTGATISSQYLIDAINECLLEWRAAVR